MAEKFEMPRVRLGDPVIWYQNGVRSSGARAAIVSQVNSDNLCLNIIDPEMMNFMIRDGVRHVDDPKSRILTDQTRQSGVWEKKAAHDDRLAQAERDEAAKIEAEKAKKKAG